LGTIAYAPHAHVETGVPVNLKDYLKQIKRWDRGWHYATRKHRMPFGFQWVDFVAGLMGLEMLIAWIRVALVLLFTVIGFGIYSTVFDQSAATFLGLSFAFDAAWLVGMGLIGSLALREWRMAAWMIPRLIEVSL
jgi:cellulose synthase/poly-beta-1,6-N-acetylglucosamine synthase-like glycosyltransferase